MTMNGMMTSIKKLITVGVATAVAAVWYMQPHNLILQEDTGYRGKVVDTVVEPKPTVHPYDSKTFSKRLVKTRNNSEIRSDNYGIGTSKKIKIQYHAGGKACNKDDIKSTIAAVLQRMPNLKTTEELKFLLYETLIAETGLGREKLELSASKWKNYGIAQFRLDTAQETLDWLEQVRPDVYEQVMAFFDTKNDLQYNLMYNVPFSIAMMAQYYWRIVPDIYANINTLEERAIVWKVAYNTNKGLGTVNKYIKSVTYHNKKA